MIYKVKHGTLSLLNRTRRQQAISDNLPQDGCGGEIGCDHANDRECRVMFVHVTERATRNSFLDRACELGVERTQVLADDAIEVARSLHGLSLDQPGIVRVRRQKIEIAHNERSKLFSRRSMFLWRCVCGAKLPKKVLEYGLVQAALVAEIVVEHCFVRVRRCRNLIRPRSGHALSGKPLFGCGQNPPRRGRILSSFTSSRHGLLLAIV